MALAFNQAFLDGAIHLDGTKIVMGPNQFRPRVTRHLAKNATLAGRMAVTSPYREGWPDLANAMEFDILWTLDTSQASQQTDYGNLRDIEAQGGTHTLAYWQMEQAYYTAYAGQVLIYLPRKNAASASIAGFTTTTHPLTCTVNDVSRTVVYKATVATDDTVPDGEIWVPNDALMCKTSPALAKADIVKIRYYPLYDVILDSVEPDLMGGVGVGALNFKFAEVEQYA